MGFHEVQFPTGISYGSVGGPGFNTSVIETDSGQEERVSRWSQSRRRYNAVEGFQDLDADLATIIEFYLARSGPANGFRFKDFTDFTTSSNHRSTPANSDVIIGTGDGSETQFQLIKLYTSGSETHTRTITKPVSGTVVVAVNAVAQTEGVDFTVDTTSGIITFNTAPGNALDVTAGFEFDVPVRFGLEIDAQLPLSYDAFESGSIPDIPLVEIISETLTQDEFYFGGAKDHGSITANISITLLSGRVQRVEADAASLEIILPDTADLPAGGPYFYIINEGSNSIDVVATAGGSAVATVATSSSVVIFLSVNAGVKTWYSK